MSEHDPASSRSEKGKGIWASIFVSKGQETVSPNYFKLKEICSCAHSEDISACKEEYNYFYDDEAKEQRLFYKELKLSMHDVFGCKDVVLNGHHHSHSLPDIEHYVILFYYNIKQSYHPIAGIMAKMYTSFRLKKKQNVAMPTIYIDFKNGKETMNISNIFNMMSEDKVNAAKIGMAMMKQWKQKAITHPKTHRFCDVKLDDMSMETTNEQQLVSGYDADGFWSIADGTQQFPSLDLLSPKRSEPSEGRLFGFNAIKPKTVIVLSAFGAAASFGFRSFNLTQ